MECSEQLPSTNSVITPWIILLATVFHAYCLHLKTGSGFGDICFSKDMTPEQLVDHLEEVLPDYDLSALEIE